MFTDSLPFPTSSPEVINRTERGLLVFSGIFILVSAISLALTQASDWSLLGHLGGWALCAVSGTNLLSRYLPERDPLLFPLAMFLSGWGLLIIDRLAPTFADRQTIWLVVGTLSAVVFAVLPHPLRWLRSFRYLLLLFGIILLLSTIVFGENPTGDRFAPQLWLGFWGLYFQPSEVLKVILVAFLASYLGEHYPAIRAAGLTNERRLSQWLTPRIFGPILLMWGVCVVVLIWQRDLGTAILFFAVFLVLLYVATGYTRILLSGIVLIIAAAMVAYYLFDVVQLRVDIWLNPWPEADGRAYQIVQSLMAFASGSIFGQGIGQGSPTYIPVVHSDFVFAALAEEWGLLGVITLIACLAILVMRGLKIAIQQPGRPFYALLAIGLSMTLGIQSLLIMGGVVKLVPLTGVTLPFLSYGGSSLLINFAALGLLIRMSAGEN